MKAYHKSTASIGDEPAREWCCVEGRPEDIDSQAIETAHEAYGGDWIMPLNVTAEDWPTNPKKSADGKRWLWLLVRV